MTRRLPGVMPELDVGLSHSDVAVPEEVLNLLDANACFIEQRRRRRPQ